MLTVEVANPNLSSFHKEIINTLFNLILLNIYSFCSSL